MSIRSAAPGVRCFALIGVASLLAGAGACDRQADPAASQPAAARAATSRPNIFLITIESLRPDHVGCYGGKNPTSPTLDALSREAVTFENCHSVTSWTLAAHASLFTGLYPTAANIVYPKDRLDASYQTLAELLAAAGYDTAAIVSGPYLRRSFKLDQGFAHYDDSAVSPAGTPSIDDVTNPQMERKLTDYLGGRGDAGRPFFLFAYFWDPHYDYIPPEPYRSMFVPPGAVPIDVTRYDTGQGKVNKNTPPEQLAYVIAQYEGEIRFTDDTLGRVFDRLRQAGLWEQTAIIVTSDHGEEFFEHGTKGHKNNLYIESVHVPLVIKPPGRTAARRDARLATLVDIFPTVLEFGGVTGRLPPHHGRSLLRPATARPIFGELATSWYMTNRKTGERWRDSDLWRSIRRDAHRLITRRNPQKQIDQSELFDSVADPRESHALGADAAERAALAAQLAQWEQRVRELGAVLGKRGEADLSADEVERLRAIGYLGDGG